MPSPDSIIHGHTDEESAYIVDDYPYGRSRTEKRYWIESVPKRGDRLCTQTLNPKTGRWNKPKKGTYSPALALYLEEQDDGRMFVKHFGLGLWRTEADAETFIEQVGADNLNDCQRVELAKTIGMARVMKHVTFTVHEGEYTEEDKARDLETQKLVNRAITVESFKAHKDMKS